MFAGVGAVIVVFIIATYMGWTEPAGHGSHDGAEASPTGQTEQAAHLDDEGNAEAFHHPSLYAVIPFVLLLGAIAIFPLLKSTEHWWEKNRNRFLVAAVLGLVTLSYYLFVYQPPAGGHGHSPGHAAPSTSSFEQRLAGTLSVLDHAVLQEYIPFIVLLFSLYTISGGIRISGDVPAHPLTNTLFIGLGGLLASFIGTTGAAMVLIRPLLDTNRERKHVQHTVIFFIFIACNCGGCLLPIGDPPLFLGYLMGVSFFWTLWNLWPAWLAVNLALLAVYYIWDHFFCYPREAKADIRRDEVAVRPLRVEGLWPNALLLAGVIVAVALLVPDPEKPFPGTNWVPYVYLREVVQLGLVALSLGLGARVIRVANKFNYHAIIEVAALFIGIFICMQPAIEILAVRGKQLKIDTPKEAFWATGSLSSFLDNAPTYVVFFETAESVFPRFFPESDPPVDDVSFADAVSLTGPEVGDISFEGHTNPASEVRARNQSAAAMLIGISLGAVFMGAMTYIGNGPNFMVRAIAEQAGVKMPSFFGYMIRYSIPVLVPVFFVAMWIFLA